MKANASTQTQHRLLPLADPLLESDPLVVASNAIVANFRAVERAVLLALGLPHTELLPTVGKDEGNTKLGFFEHAFEGGPTRQAPTSAFFVPPSPAALPIQPVHSGAAHSETLTRWAVEEHARMRLASLTSAAVRAAEDNVLELLGSIAALVPHGAEGFAYARARLSPSRQDLLRARDVQEAQRRRVTERATERMSERPSAARIVSPRRDSTPEPAAAPVAAAQQLAPTPAAAPLLERPPEKLDVEAASSGLVTTPRRRVEAPPLTPTLTPRGARYGADVERVTRLQHLASTLLTGGSGGGLGEAPLATPRAAAASPIYPAAALTNPMTRIGTSPLRSRRAQSYAAQLESILRSAAN